MKTDIEENKKKENRGGARVGSGRPREDRKCMLSVRISLEASEMIKTMKNKSEYVDELIKRDYEEKQCEAVGDVAGAAEGLED